MYSQDSYLSVKIGITWITSVLFWEGSHNLVVFQFSEIICLTFPLSDFGIFRNPTLESTLRLKTRNISYGFFDEVSWSLTIYTELFGSSNVSSPKTNCLNETKRILEASEQYIWDILNNLLFVCSMLGWKFTTLIVFSWMLDNREMPRESLFPQPEPKGKTKRKAKQNIKTWSELDKKQCFEFK